MCFYTGNNKKGIFTIFALWIFLILSLFSLGLAFRSFVLAKKTKLIISRARVNSLAVSGIKLVKKILELDASDETANKVDYLGEEWSNKISRQISYALPKKTGRLTVMIEDECARIRIDENNEAFLKELFMSCGIDNTEEKLKFLWDYIDSDDVNRQGLEGTNSEENVKNKGLGTLEELLLVANITKEDYNKIEPLVTVFGEGKININTLKSGPLVVLLAALVAQGAITEQIKQDVIRVRFGDNQIEGDEDDGHYGEGGGALGAELGATFTTISNFFRINSIAEIEGVTKQVSCVVKLDRNLKNIDGILYWYEK